MTNPTDPPPPEQRLRFAEFEIERLPSGRCRASVLLTHEGKEHRGESAGLASQAGEMRCAAEATVEALSRSTGGKLTLEIVGVKSVRVFDSMVVIVSISVRGEGAPPRVVGSCLTEGDIARAAALAVLNATNRILGNRLFMR